MPAAIVVSEVALLRKARSPPSRRTVNVPERRGAAARDHSPPSVNVERNGSVVPVIRATVTSGTAVKLPEVVIFPSSHTNSARRTLPSATARRDAPTRMRVRAISTVVGAASLSVREPRLSSASSEPFHASAAIVISAPGSRGRSNPPCADAVTSRSSPVSASVAACSAAVPVTPMRAVAKVQPGVTTSFAVTSTSIPRAGRSRRSSIEVPAAIRACTSMAPIAMPSGSFNRSPLASSSMPARGGKPARTAFAWTAPSSARAGDAGKSGASSARFGASSIDGDAVAGVAWVPRAARRREPRPARRKIDRGIADRFASDVAARRACERDARQPTAREQARCRPARAMRARACLSPRFGRRASPAGNALYAAGSNRSAVASSSNAALGVERDAAAAGELALRRSARETARRRRLRR